ncbi:MULTISPECIES: c-type cytochrome [unclassified Variovorax]|uniref:c-type cytochrome n=1 Tax=unclassified Variovorax TaxID=663243 RepID=UPI0008388928|nr:MULTISPECIES: c-type cytochrome [unclassified Variovorax]PNG59871.1 Cytochrome c-552 [Variovorax sp. B4]PNG60338.1 Cytochrome c-552 [Variovorax sp. B2]VTV13805.1 Cytochrome c552 [Variovorax sp. WDL1]
MSSFREIATSALLLMAAGVAAAQPAAYPGIGRAATPKEIKAWDIDVRPDFKGLPKGSGSVKKGMEVWEGKCASCHGVFGESNEVFSPIVGGTTKEDIKSGQVARLNDRGFPGRTTLMKIPTLSTLWDYIHRAMPWSQPKSLSPDEVYAVTAYILNMGEIVPDDYTLSDRNIAQAQTLLPNRNGMTTDHAMWPGPEFGRRKPDVNAKACMKDCLPEIKVASQLPDFARNAHGNLATQVRPFGAQHGVDTSKPPAKTLQESDALAAQVAAASPAGGTKEAPPQAAAAAGAAKPAAAAGNDGTLALLQKNTCVACHGMDTKLVGPSFRDIAKKYAGRADALDYLAGKIKSGGSGVWGAIPMPPQTLPESDAKSVAHWLAGGAK